jgi:DNA-binding transcriptional LysR family regulator
VHPQLDNRIRTRLRLRHLELLDTLGETLNIHHAAPRLHLSQPATSKLLQELETLYGTQLFERLARGLRPTAAGETAIRWARVLLYEIGESIVETQLVASGSSGRIRLGAQPVAIATLYPRVLSLALESMPELTISVVEAPLDALLAALLRKEIDIVLARLTLETRHASFTSQALYAEGVRLVTRPGHPLLRKRKLSMRDLAGQDWILPPDVAKIRHELDSAFDAEGLPRPRARLETTSPLMIETILAKTEMIGIIPESVAKHYEPQGRLRILALDLPVNMPPVGIVQLASVARAPLLDSFVNLVRTAVHA